MRCDIIISGFGGQGILFSGQMLAYMALVEGYEVSWLPSYGPEMRGGTANCNLIISSERIRSPLVRNPLGLIAMNKPSLEKFEQCMKPGGVLVMNADMVDRHTYRDDVTEIAIEADSIAGRIGNAQIANLVALGAFIGATGILRQKSLLPALEKAVSKARADLIPLNLKALECGIEAGRSFAGKGAVP